MSEELVVKWTETLAADLGITPALGVDAVLAVAADAAHGVVRPAAPMTTFLVGVAIGQAGADADRVAQVLQTVQEALARWESAT